MKKKAIIATVLMVSAAIITACGSSELNDAKLSKPEPPVIMTQPTTVATTEPFTEPTTENKDKTLEERVVTKLSPVKWKYDNAEIKTQIVGNDEFGYIEVPEDWFLDEDMDSLSDSIITYENEAYILNGNYAMDSMIMDNCDSSLASTVVESILREAESDQDVTEVAYDYPEIDGKQAVIIQFKYDELNKLKYTLCIANEEGSKMHVITYESSNPNIVDLLKTFTRTAPEGFSTETGTNTTTTSSDSTEETSDSTTTTTTAIG